MIKQAQKADFIKDEVIYNALEAGKNKTREELEAIIEKGEQAKGLSLEETAALLQNDCPELEDKLFKAARKVKDTIYGTRIVMFAPLYVSDYCVNSCRYCGYKCTNRLERRKLTDDEIRREVEIIINLGHKRIALEAGEDDKNCPIDY
ncbi:MAG: [FeFe] hydrogenase H-cluster radical SAM maturase HydG, partial [Clostridiales bacterium]|nr:[FeFe] hydrogenase H-cluster radical SAM maturase HydG [Clostridiales bacterium]